MDFGFDETQEDLRRTVRSFLSERSPEARVREIMETTDGYDRALWSEMASMGLISLAISEDHGGAGCGMLEVGVVMEEAGRALLPAPLLSTVLLATSALQASGDELAQAEFLPQIADGSLTATLAWVGDEPTWDSDGVALSASEGPSGWVVDGVTSFVLDGHTAGLVLVAARTPAGVSIFRAEPTSRTKLVTLDATRPLARLSFEAAPATLIGADGDGWKAVEHATRIAVIGLGAEQVGAGQAVLDSSVEYAKVREQFGKPIGSFQAIKHKLADVLLEVDSARSAAYYALWVASDPSAAHELAVVASLVKAYCSDASFHAAAANIQVHGGIGFTWEHPAHLYFKRAKGSQLLFGDPTHHRELVAQHVLD